MIKNVNPVAEVHYKTSFEDKPKETYYEVIEIESPRKYKQAWELLKKNRIVILRCNHLVHNRIVRMMRKEKDEDAGFKIANQDDPLRLLATSDKEGGKVTFRLRQKFGIDEPKTAEEIQI